MSSGKKLAKETEAAPKAKSAEGNNVSLNNHRFEGDGVKFECKLVGTTDVSFASGDRDGMCTEAIRKVKEHAIELKKESGKHKQKIVLHVTLNGIRIVDEKTQEVQHKHPINKISYITRDLDDKKIFGYIYSPDTTGYRLFVVKSKKPAEVVTGTVYELFQVVCQLQQQARLTKEENLQAELRNCREQLREKELQEAKLHEQLREKNQQEENSQRRLREIQLQVTRMEQRLREKDTELQRKVSHSANLQRLLREKESQNANLREQLREKYQREENSQRHLREMEQQLREKDEQEENLRGQLREIEQQLTGKDEQQEENSQRQLREMEQQVASLEQQLREQERLSSIRGQQVTIFQGTLRVKELQEAILHELLRENDQQEENSQRQLREIQQQLRQLREIQQQLREKDEEKENLQRQLREMGQQLRGKDEQEENSQRQLREIQEQLREKNEQEQNLQRQLREMEQQRRQEEDQKKNLQRQRREMEQQLTNLQGQCRHKEDETAHLLEQVTTLEGQVRTKEQEVNELEETLLSAQQTLSEHQRQQSTPDWVISREEIQLTDKILGRGGWGSVVEGKYCNCDVAVKRIHELILSPHNRTLFEREIDIASRCRHPCLLQFIGATHDEGNPLFVTELMESSLRALLEQRPLPATEVSIISFDVARALSYLHQKKPSPIIHRDISSANVLLWRQGDQWRGKVSDYGTANFMQHTMTVGPGAMIYTAPEALTSNQTVKVDVYSFGVLLCEMCIQELPDPERRDQQIAMVTNRQLRALIRRCLQSEPGARPNMEEIIEELEEQFNGM